MQSGRWEPVEPIPVRLIAAVDRHDRHGDRRPARGERPLLERLADDARRRRSRRRSGSWCAEAIAAGGLVHLFGTGHSRIAVEEMFPRYGSYPGFHPIVELSMTFHTQVVGANGQRQAMFIERVEGLAEAILANFELRPAGRDDRLQRRRHDRRADRDGDGRAAARAAGRRGHVGRAVARRRRRGTRRGTRLLDHADVVLDLCTPPGDALVAIDGLDTPVGPGSTLAAVALVNEIKVRTAELLVERGAMPPVLTSAAVVGRRGARQGCSTRPTPSMRGAVPGPARRGSR